MMDLLVDVLFVTAALSLLYGVLGLVAGLAERSLRFQAWVRQRVLGYRP